MSEHSQDTQDQVASNPPISETETRKPLSWWNAWWNDHPRRTADCTLALAVGTIGLAVFALLQLSAADTALRVTERAYITVGTPLFDPATKFLTFSLSNNGHIPSGKIEIIVHEATMNSSAPNAELNINNAVEYYWERHKLSGAPPVLNFIGFTMPIREFSQDKYTPEGVYQGILVAGSILYDDGFPTDGRQTWPFCYANTYHLVLKQIFWVPCDAERLTPLME